MPNRSNRLVFGAALKIARIFGVLLILLAIFGFLQLKSVIGNFSSGITLTMSLTLAVIGFAWLFGIQIFLRFFDRYLARN